MEDIISNCLDEFDYIHKLVSGKDNILIGRSNNYPNKEIIIKIIPIFPSEDSLILFMRELEITKRMGENGIGPLLFMNNQNRYRRINTIVDYGILLMEKLDGTLAELWQYIGLKTREKVKDFINNKIITMHNLGIVHGDLHSSNIMYREINGEINIYIIDYGTALEISSLCNNQDYLRWQENNIGKSLIDNIDYYDFLPWIEHIPIPTEIFFF
jgi:serine/threonine protein kinase